MKHIYKGIFIILLFACFGCNNSENQISNSEKIKEDNRIVISKEQFNANNMALGSIKEKAFPVNIKVNGMIDVPPENKATVNSIMGGYVKTIPLLVGDKVKKGQVLLTIENPEFVKLQQDYVEIKEQLNYLKSEYERQKTMFNENIISQKVYLKAESEYKSASARYNGLRKQLTLLNISPTRAEQGNITSTTNLYAPIDGSITKVNVSKGTYVSPSTAILEIIDNSHIHLELSVFEKDIMHIKKDQNIQFSIPEASDAVYEAKVYLVGTSIEENRTITVHAHPLNDSHQFLTGMYVNAEIETEVTNASALPLTTYVETEGDYYVLVLDEENEKNYYFNQVKVNIGRTKANSIELKETQLIEANPNFLVNGAFSLIGN
jgi:membrane fusion protein, heavy metal efflux system